jgi:hypothetical protein
MIDEAYILSRPEGYDHAFHKVKWEYPDVWGDLYGFTKTEELPEEYGKHTLIRWVNMGEGFRWPDLTECVPMGWVLVSAKMKDLLLRETEAAHYYQFIKPFHGEDSAECGDIGYELMNLRDHVAALDIQGSDLVLKEDGSVDRIFDYVLRHAAVEGLKHLFRIREYWPTIGLSRQLAQVLRESGMTGFSLREVSLACPPGATWVFKISSNLPHRHPL